MSSKVKDKHIGLIYFPNYFVANENETSCALALSLCVYLVVLVVTSAQILRNISLVRVVRTFRWPQMAPEYATCKRYFKLDHVSRGIKSNSLNRNYSSRLCDRSLLKM